MKGLWIGLALFFVPMLVSAESVDFLRVKVTSVESSLECSGWSFGGCRAVFLIEGVNFQNMNGQGGVNVGGEWAEVLRWTSDTIVATASEEQLGKMPIVSIDTTLHRPSIKTSDETIAQMFDESVDVALASIKTNTDGQRYIVAGPKYGNPERTYYRDSYWTSGMILMIEPSVVRDQILLLARGVEENGSAPSAVTIEEDAPQLALWADHYDAGSYFIMMVHDYIAWTGDSSVMFEWVDGRTVLDTMKAVIGHQLLMDTDGDRLPEKPEGSLQDWLDTIPRGGEVLYNVVLFYHALNTFAELSDLVGLPAQARMLKSTGRAVRDSINRELWNDEKGYFYERCDAAGCVDRITNESSLAVLYGVVEEENRDRFLESLLVLESRVNRKVRYGDWGVLNAWPFYEGFPEYVYHNGTDWPFLDGINAGARLLYGNDDWYYPMTRWWEYDNEKWPERTLPENISPIDQHGGDYQAWSVNPITMFIRYGLGVNPDLSGVFSEVSSPIGDIRIENIVVNGQRQSIDAPAR